MKLSPSLIAVKRISSNAPRSEFDDDGVEKLAKLFLESGGIVNPIILERVDERGSRYEVLSGHLEYHAAVRAREMDPRKGEHVSAYVVEPSTREAIEAQATILRSAASLPPTEEAVSTAGAGNETSSLRKRIGSLESRLGKELSELIDASNARARQVDSKLRELEGKLPKAIEPIRLLNELPDNQLSSELIRAGVNKPTAKRLLDSRSKDGEFRSCSDVMERVNKLGPKTMLAIVDRLRDY